MNLVKSYKYEMVRMNNTDKLKITIETASDFGVVSGAWSLNLSATGTIERAFCKLGCSGPAQHFYLGQTPSWKGMAEAYIKKPHIMYCLNSELQVLPYPQFEMPVCEKVHDNYGGSYFVSNNLYSTDQSCSWVVNYQELKQDLQDLISGEFLANALLHRRRLTEKRLFASQRKEMDKMKEALHEAHDLFANNNYQLVV